MNVTVYSKNNCPACEATKKQLDAQGTEYSVVNIEDDDTGFEKVIEMGYNQVPVVVSSRFGSWSGHQPAKLLSLK